MYKVCLIVWISCMLIACGGQSTKITGSWHEPATTYKKSEDEKVFVMAMVKNAMARRTIEDQLVERIGRNAVASYITFSDDMMATLPVEVFSNKIKKDGYKYVLMMRLANVETETSYVSGNSMAYYGGYALYYGYNAALYSTPGYYSTEKKYFVETTVFSVDPDKLVWTANTKTVNPGKVEKVVNDISHLVAEKMKSDGFLK